MVLKVSDLPDSLAVGIVLHCSNCEEISSAQRGDYFYLHPDAELRCECDNELVLARREVRFVPVTTEEASDGTTN